MTTTPQAALLSEAIKLANEFRVTMPREVLAIWGAEVQAELRRLDALVAHLTADRDDTANELALRTKHNLALTNERDLLAKLQATQEPVQAGELPPLPEPDSFLFQHDETGNTMFVDAQQVEWGFEKNNPRLHKIGGAFTGGQMQAYARAAISARKPLTDEQRLMFKNIEGMLDAYVASIRQYGDYEVWHYIPEVEAHRDDLASYVSEVNGIGLEVKT